MRVRPERSPADRPLAAPDVGLAELRVGVVEHLLLVAAHRRLGRCGWRRRCGRRRRCRRRGRGGRCRRCRRAGGSRAFLAASAAAAAAGLPQHRAPPDRRPPWPLLPEQRLRVCNLLGRGVRGRLISSRLRGRFGNPRGGGLASRLLGRQAWRARPSWRACSTSTEVWRSVARVLRRACCSPAIRSASAWADVAAASAATRGGACLDGGCLTLLARDVGGSAILRGGVGRAEARSRSCRRVAPIASSAAARSASC